MSSVAVTFACSALACWFCYQAGQLRGIREAEWFCRKCREREARLARLARLTEADLRDADKERDADYQDPPVPPDAR